MKPTNVIAIVSSFAVLLWLKSRRNLLNNTMFTFSGVKIDGSILNPELLVKITANNPTASTQDINSIEGQIYLNNTILIGNVLQLKKQVIAAKTTSIIELPVNVKLTGIINTISQLLKSKHGTFSFEGIINVYGINIPIKQFFTL